MIIMTTTKQALGTYLGKIDRNKAKLQKFSERSYYHSLHTLIESVGDNVDVVDEMKKQDAGIPDFTIFTKDNEIIGYIEAKIPGTDLVTIEKTPQIQRYIKAFPNFILTDFYKFRLYINGVFVEEMGLVSKEQTTISDESDTRFLKLINRFLSKRISVETGVEIIAELLADITKDTLKPAIDVQLNKEIIQESGELYNSYMDFKENLLHGLTTEQFVDMYAQTITYGLLTAKMNHTDGTTFDRKTALFDIPSGFGVLRAIFTFIITDTLPSKIETAISEIVSILIRTNPGRVLKQYYDNDQDKDWFIHFYETFLSKYDAKEAKVKGVYYTPPAVVSYITRSVNEILKNKDTFNKELGFGNKDVSVLDPAAGTLSFITNACQIAIDEMKKNQGDGKVSGFIKDHILKRFYGYEIMMTPYVLGHLKMKTLLDKNNYPIGNERIRLLLNNALDPMIQGNLPPKSGIGGAMKKEADCARKVRNKESILAIIGNPPYSVNSANKDMFATEIEIYKAGVKINKDGLKREKGIVALSDDYIKFIRLAHKRIDDQGEGIIGFITNNSYLSGLIHRGMRKELLRSFDKIYILNLHGHAMVDPSNDKNVFDIKQGVSIVIFVKTSKRTDDAKVYYSELIGTRGSKYDYLNDNDINTTNWEELNIYKPYYFFEPKDFPVQNDNFVPINDIFGEMSAGIITARDEMTTQKTSDEMQDVINDFPTLDVETARIKYNLRNDTDGWKIKLAQNDVIQSIINNNTIEHILYRPFDIRYTYYTGRSNGFMSRPAKKIMKHMMEDNIGMLVCRQQSKIGFHHTFISDGISVYTSVSNRGKEKTSVCPLYLYTNNNRTPNIDTTIISKLTTTYNTESTPEDIFYYIYGILHSNTYRRKYAELLKIDFPKIPFTSNHDMFMKIGAIGKQLADLHLMKPKVFNHSTIKYNGIGNHEVKKIAYDESTQQVSINKTQYFDGISKDIWEYQIGGYKPMQKWLKDRRHDNLTNDDVDHYRYIGAALEKTIALQSEIDTMYDEIDSGEIVKFDTGGYFKYD
jgi:type I restriction-modification system DNA methylase subunit